jgi:predicted transcriptional regulator
LVNYLDASQGIEDQGIAAPQEEVEVWLKGRGWRLPETDLRADESAGLEAEIAALASSAARSLAKDLVARAVQDVEELPDARFDDALKSLGPDPIALAERCAVSPLAIMRRLAGVAELQAGLVVCDASGTLTFRKAAAGFPLPRFGSACPLWPLYAALARPMQPVEVRVVVAGQGERHHRAVAWSEVRHPAGLRGPELREAAMLILSDAGAGAPLPIGTSCRICPRGGCPARREPSILAVEGAGA